jgi:hypothetical protein
MMKKFWNVVKAVVLILLLLAICFAVGFGISKQKWKDRAILAEENVDALNLSQRQLGDGFALTQKVTRQQFEDELGAYIDSINSINAENIRLKQVLRLTRFELSKSISNRAVASTDTFLIEGTDTIIVGRKGVLKDNCFSVSVFVPDTGNVFYFDQVLDIQGSIVVYRRRKHQVSVAGLKLFRYGKFVDRAVMNTNCDSITVNIEDIEVIMDGGNQ